MTRLELCQLFIEAQDKVSKLSYKKSYHPNSLKLAREESNIAWKNYEDAIKLERKNNYVINKNEPFLLTKSQHISHVITSGFLL